MTDLEKLSIEDQIRELKAAGWTAVSTGIWKSPQGGLFRGPHGAWKAMKAQDGKQLQEGMLLKRDPRVNPMPGDVLLGTYRGKPDERQVDEVHADRLVYVGPSVCSPSISLKGWRSWAKNATVIQTSPTPSTTKGQ